MSNFKVMNLATGEYVPINSHPLSAVEAVVWAWCDFSSEPYPRDYRYCDINSTVSWIIKGYQAYKRRFRRLDNYNVSNRLFNSIVSCCDDLLKHAEEGETHSLHIDFQAYRSFIDL
jgi:hypothetical protein